MIMMLTVTMEKGDDENDTELMMTMINHDDDVSMLQ
jgi:hypothetical protein